MVNLRMFRSWTKTLSRLSVPSKFQELYANFVMRWLIRRSYRAKKRKKGSSILRYWFMSKIMMPYYNMDSTDDDGRWRYKGVRKWTSSKLLSQSLECHLRSSHKHRPHIWASICMQTRLFQAGTRNDRRACTGSARTSKSAPLLTAVFVINEE